MFISHCSLALIRPTYSAIGFTQNFTNTAAALPANITFTRSTTANRFNSAGTLTSTAIDVARANANQDYNPSTLAARGWLIEGSATNLLPRAEAFDNAAWTKTNSSITANGAVAPDGTTTMDKLVEALDVAQVHTVAEPATVVAGANYTSSVFVKAAERTKLRAVYSTTGGIFADADISAGTIGAISTFSGGTGTASGITSLQNDIKRISITGYGASGTTGNVQLELLDASSQRTYNGDGTSGEYLWGAMLSLGAYATSYYATAAGTATRGADNGDILNLSSIGFNTAQGTLIAWVMFEGVGNSNSRRVLSFNDGTTSNEIAILMADGGSDLIRLLVTTGGATQADVSSTVGATANNLYKVAVSWAANSFRIAVNGTAGTEDTSGTLPTVDRLSFGKDGANSNHLDGWLQQATYIPSQLTTAQLQAMTT